MAQFEIVPFTAARLPAVIKFTERAWNRPRSEAFYRWRYLESPAQRMVLALSGEECVAMTGAFLRDYRLDAGRRTWLETLDWYCLPEFRGNGLGVRVFRALMDGTEPMITIGGTTATTMLLPKMGWRKMTTVTRHLLPLDGSVVTDALHRRFRIPPRAGRAAFALLARPWFSPRIRTRPSGGEVRPAARVGEEILRLYEGETGYRVLPLPNLPHLRWLTEGFPSAGPFRVFHFVVGGELRGWSFLRVHGSEGHRGVTLVDLYAPRPDEALYTWMVSESLIRTAEFRPIAIDTQTSCPILRQALRRNHFLDIGPAPVHVWPAELPGAVDPVHLVHNASDGALFPYPAGPDDSAARRES
jgi:hypothetical protein